MHKLLINKSSCHAILISLLTDNEKRSIFLGRAGVRKKRSQSEPQAQYVVLSLLGWVTKKSKSFSLWVKGGRGPCLSFSLGSSWDWHCPSSLNMVINKSISEQQLRDIHDDSSCKVVKNIQNFIVWVERLPLLNRNRNPSALMFLATVCYILTHRLETPIQVVLVVLKFFKYNV